MPPFAPPSPCSEPGGGSIPSDRPNSFGYAPQPGPVTPGPWLSTHIRPDADADRGGLLNAIIGQCEMHASQLGVLRGRGWNSSKTMQDWTDPYTPALIDWIAAQVARERSRLSAWANIQYRDSAVMTHAHSGEIAGVYYVQLDPDPRVNGQLYFDDRQLAHCPAEGQLVVFASGERHSVTRHQSDVPRVSVAFNVARA